MAQTPPPSPSQPPQCSSRLSRLLTLLDTGSTQQTRFAAARQIGDIARSRLHEVTPLLRQVFDNLRSRKWDTRVASAKAIGSIAENSKRVLLDELVQIARRKVKEVCVDGADELCLFRNKNDASITLFRSFDINKVLEFGVLLASGGQEFDLDEDNNSKTLKERLARQKKNLRRRLGLDLCEQFMDVSDMIKDEDLVFPVENNHKFNLNNRSDNNNSSGSSCSSRRKGGSWSRSFRSQGPSARELNLLKRKAKVTDVRGPLVVGPMPKGSVSPPDAVVVGPMDSTTDEDTGVENEGDVEDKWPFHRFVEQLLVDMFDPVWELRHGSIMALREILTYQGAYAGVSMNDPGRGKGSGCMGEKVKENVKRDREIDLNMKIVEDESLKKPRIEGDVDLNGESSCGQFNMGTSIGAVMIQPEFSVLEAKSTCDGVPIMTGSANVTEEKDVNVKKNIPDTISGNPEIMNLVGAAQNSWLKNCEFLQDCAICFLCVLSLDRFGDYVSDQVVAPVRETCAQALGAVLKYMAP